MKIHFFSFIRKTSSIGFDRTWNIRGNQRRDRHRTEHIEVEGNCCWEIQNRSGEREEFGIGLDRTPRISYISRIRSKDCNQN